MDKNAVLAHDPRLMTSLDSQPERSVHAVHGGASFEAIGDDFQALDRRNDVVNADVLDAWYPPSPRVVAAIERDLEWLLRTSPPTHAEGLRRTISRARGIPEQNLLVGGGSSALAYMALPHLVRPGDRALLLDPTYGEYAHVLEVAHGLRCQRLPLSRENGFRVDVDALVKAMETCDSAILVNPNSPTGTVLGHDELRRVLGAVSRFGWLVVDETYVDFAPGVPSVERWVAEHDNLVVLKSMSKHYALSGVRVGYLAGPRRLVEALEPGMPPWSVSLLGQVAAVAALADDAYYRARVEETRRLRDALVAELEATPGLCPHGSAASFVLIELLGDQRAADVVAALAERGVYLRDCDSLGRTMEGRFVRTAVKDAASNARIVAALREVVRPPAASAIAGDATAAPAGLLRASAAEPPPPPPIIPEPPTPVVPTPPTPVVPTPAPPPPPVAPPVVPTPPSPVVPTPSTPVLPTPPPPSRPPEPTGSAAR